MAARRQIGRRAFMRSVAAGTACAAVAEEGEAVSKVGRKPNVVFVFADQWRRQATAYAGDPNVRTPNLDKLAAQGVHCRNAVSCSPVCSPYRASLITGQYPLTHGVFMNDLYLRPEAVSVAEAFNDNGYQTAYIGKWHLDGHGRSSYIPRERRQGFQFWKVLECTHAYNHSPYYGDADAKLLWEGYDAIAQTREAQRYLREERGDGPFALFLSWGPPHNPYETAPEEHKRLYDAADVELRPNVPHEMVERARKDLAGYYAHCSALDACLGDLLETLREEGLEENTVFVFTSDHGDMLGSQGQSRKQRPWDESIRVPFLLSYPALLGRPGRAVDHFLNAPDVMPTLLSLCGLPIPATVEGRDLSKAILEGDDPPEDDAALIACHAPFGEWTRRRGGREYRGVRTHRYTYVRDLSGPWLLYDNEKDPYQLRNVVNEPAYAEVQAHHETLLAEKLEETHDAFLPGDAYIKQWGYTVDETGTVPYGP